MKALSIKEKGLLMYEQPLQDFAVTPACTSNLQSVEHLARFLQWVSRVNKAA